MPLVKYNDPVLYQKTEPVDMGDDNAKARVDLAAALIIEMLKHKGLGLSANQMGVPQSVFALRRNKPITVFNPYVLRASKEDESFWEGCLTFPGLYMMLKRPVWIEVQYQNVSGGTVNEKLEGMDARVFMHEMHHMKGEIFFHKKPSWLKLRRALDKCPKGEEYAPFIREYWVKTMGFDF